MAHVERRSGWCELRGRLALVVAAGIALAACRAEPRVDPPLDGDAPWAGDFDATDELAGADVTASDGDGGGESGNDGGVDGGGDAPVAAEVCVTGTFSPFFGNIHAHSKNSDGRGTPAEAFTYARDVGGLDVFILTDHVEQLFLPGDPWYVPRWTACKDAAEDASSATFVGLCGFEYGAGIDPLALDTTGHANVFFAPDPFDGLMLDFHEFYTELGACPTCLGQFNHPGESESQTWNDWEYDATAATHMALFEMNGGGPTWDLLFDVLDAGWHLSPSYNQDNHSADWGTRNSNRTGFWLDTFSAAGVERAIAGRRTFSTEDANASLQVSTGDGCFLGSQLSRGGTQQFRVTATDGDASEGFDRVELYGPGQSLLAGQACNNATPCIADLVVDLSALSYVLARAVQTDGNILVSGPIRNIR